MNGVEAVSRGCIKKKDQVPLLCKTSSFSGVHKKRHTGGQYEVICCEEDYCNNGSFPSLPEVTFHGKSIKINATLLRTRYLNF